MRMEKALKYLTEEAGVILHDTPADYFPAYMAAAKASLEKNADKKRYSLNKYGILKKNLLI